MRTDSEGRQAPCPDSDMSRQTKRPERYRLYFSTVGQGAGYTCFTDDREEARREREKLSLEWNVVTLQQWNQRWESYVSDRKENKRWKRALLAASSL